MAWPLLLGRSGLSRGAVLLARPAKGRALTPGEVDMARQIFRESVAYGRVKVHQGRFLPGCGDNAMTPFGEMYFPGAGYHDDFSQASDAAKIWFMHEMVHVWQHQWGRSVMGQGLLLAVKGGYGPGAHAYDYDPDQDQGKTFSAFNMEQQGDLIAHYFDARYLCNSTAGKRPQRVAMLPFYEAVLADVLRNPADARCLPRSTRVWR